MQIRLRVFEEGTIPADLMTEKMDFKVSAGALRMFCVDCLAKVGLSQEDARTTADNLIFANLRGVDSHGVIRLKIYADRLRAGGIDCRARLRVVSQGAADALVDANNSMGQVAGVFGMKVSLGRAAESGFGIVAVRNSNHFGAAAYYAMMALEKGMIGFAATNSGPSMAPSGGRQARLGNNPLAIAVPAGKQLPIVLDMATGAVAWGKIFMAQQEKKKIPLSWALDETGAPTDDPDKAAHKGLIQPTGGHKGYGLSLIVDILTGVLSGSAFSTHLKSLYKDLQRPSGCAHLFAALRIDRFMPTSEFVSRVDEIIDLMWKCPPAPSVERIYVPGEIEQEIHHERLAQGIPINPILKEELAALAKELEVHAPF